jgi:D-alanine-D-alanine ligase
LDANGVPKLLEVNPNPGWCWDGHLAKMAGINEISYPKLLEMILQATEQRIGQTQAKVEEPALAKAELAY